MTAADLLVLLGTIAMAAGIGGALTTRHPRYPRLIGLGAVGLAAFAAGCVLLVSELAVPPLVGVMP